MPQQRVPADVIPAPSRRPVVVSVLAAVIAAAWAAMVVDAALDLSRFVRGWRALGAVLSLAKVLWFAFIGTAMAKATWRGERSVWYVWIAIPALLGAVVVLGLVPVLLVQGSSSPAAEMVPAFLAVAAVLAVTALLRPVRAWFGVACPRCGKFRSAAESASRAPCSRCSAAN